MTHEHHEDPPYLREDGGPEHDAGLPDATDIAEYDDVEDSLYQVFCFDDGPSVPRWAGTEPNEV
jgi:hypothetical protein